MTQRHLDNGASNGTDTPSGRGFVGSPDQSQSESSWFTNPDPNNPKGTQPK